MRSWIPAAAVLSIQTGSRHWARHPLRKRMHNPDHSATTRRAPSPHAGGGRFLRTLLCVHDEAGPMVVKVRVMSGSCVHAWCTPATCMHGGWCAWSLFCLYSAVGPRTDESTGAPLGWPLGGTGDACPSWPHELEEAASSCNISFPAAAAAAPGWVPACLLLSLSVHLPFSPSTSHAVPPP